MSDSNLAGILPSPEPRVLLAVLFGLLALVCAAVLLDLLRRRAAKRRHLNGEWRTVRQIADEKGLSPEEWEILRGFIRRWSRDDPLRAVTVRQHFNRCVEDEIEAVTAGGDEGTLERTGVALRDIRVTLGLDYIPFGQRIHSTRELSSGQHLLAAPDAQSPPRWIRLRVSSVDEAHFQAVFQHGEMDSASSWNAGDKIRCRMWREDDARYIFTARVVRLDADPPALVFRHALQLNRMQARAHYRVRYEQPTSVAVLNASPNGDVENIRERPAVAKFRGRITSLSAGGIALVVQQPVPKQVFLRVTIELPGAPPLDMNARIVSTAPISGGRYLIRATFVAVDEELRDVIARYVLQRQTPAGGREEIAE